MINYTRKGNDPSTYFAQTDNAEEAMFGKMGARNVLETCGPTAACMALAAIEHVTSIYTPGGYIPQPEDVLTIYFNDPRNYSELQKARALDPTQYMGNEIPQWYTAAIPAVFGAKCNFIWGIAFANIKDAIDKNIAVMLCLVNPGHFIAVVGYDDDKMELIYNDPWPQNYWPQRLYGTDPFNRRMTFEEFTTNVSQYRIEIGG